MKTVEKFKKGEVYHLDSVIHLSRAAMEHFRKPINEKEDRFYGRPGYEADMSDCEVCVKSFTVTEIITYP